MMPLLLVAQVGIPVWSALILKGELEAEQAEFYRLHGGGMA
jgi:hypothetical protein